jgi:hypothetical protein
MKESQLQGLAEEYYFEGLDLKYTDSDKAIINLSVAYGLYRSLEDLQKAGLCVEQLRSLGLPNEVIDMQKAWGMDHALFCHNLEEAVNMLIGRE